MGTAAAAAASAATACTLEPKPTSKAKSKELEKEECCVCMESAVEVVLPCSHAFCKKCNNDWMHQSAYGDCPVCRAPVRTTSAHDSILKFKTPRYYFCATENRAFTCV